MRGFMHTSHASPAFCSPEQEVWYGKGEQQDYEMAHYWDTNFKMNTFGMDIEEVCTADLDCAAVLWSHL